jgi:hypothetical protein
VEYGQILPVLPKQKAKMTTAPHLAMPFLWHGFWFTDHLSAWTRRSAAII